MRMRVKILIFVLVIIVLAYALTQQQKQKSQACFQSNCFSIEIANTQAQREQGLMNRTAMDKNKGMFFIFDNEGIYPFWMKNTLISLDMIWIDKNYKVVFIGENEQPCRAEICPIINPGVNAGYVLEINAGLSKEFNIKTGDLVEVSPGL